MIRLRQAVIMKYIKPIWAEIHCQFMCEAKIAAIFLHISLGQYSSTFNLACRADSTSLLTSCFY